MSLSYDEAIAIARRIATRVLVDYQIEPVRDEPLPKLKPGATYVCSRERPGAASEVDLIVKSHHRFVESTFQFPVISLTAQLLVEADEMFLDPAAQRYFYIAPNDVERVRDSSVELLVRHFLDSIFWSHRYHLPMVLEQAIISLSNTVGKQQWEINWRSRREPGSESVKKPKWVLQEPDLRYAFRKFPNVQFPLLHLIDSISRSEIGFQEKLRKGGEALLDKKRLAEEHRVLVVAYGHLKKVYCRALRMSERRARHDRSAFEQKWVRWVRRRYPNLRVADLCRDFPPFELSHRHLGSIYEIGHTYIPTILQELRSKRPR